MGQSPEDGGGGRVGRRAQNVSNGAALEEFFLCPAFSDIPLDMDMGEIPVYNDLNLETKSVA